MAHICSPEKIEEIIVNGRLKDKFLENCVKMAATALTHFFSLILTSDLIFDTRF